MVGDTQRWKKVQSDNLWLCKTYSSKVNCMPNFRLFLPNNVDCWIFTESAHKSRCPPVCLSCVPLFFGFLKHHITPIYKCHKSNRSISKRFLWEQLRKDIGLRFGNFGSEVVKKRSVELLLFFFLSLPLIAVGYTSKSAAASYCA